MPASPRSSMLSSTWTRRRRSSRSKSPICGGLPSRQSCRRRRKRLYAPEKEIVMTSTGLDVFDSTLQKSNAVLAEIEDYYGWQDRRHQSYAALRAVLHTLRDRLNVDEAVNFASQLPLLIKGVYFDQWDPSRVPVQYDDDEFFAEVQHQMRYEVEDMAELIAVVLKAVGIYVTAGEFKGAFGMLPKKLLHRLGPALLKVA